MSWVVSEEKALRGYCVEWLEPGEIVLSKRHRLYKGPEANPERGDVASFPSPAWRGIASLVRPAQRLLRFLVYNVVKLADGSFFVTFDRSVGVLEAGQIRRLEGLERPCRVLRGAVAVDDTGVVYFGEYLSNRERGPMRVYRYRPGARRVEIAYRFPAGSIRHIHGIYWDPYTRALWCLTGDLEGECRMLFTRDGFASLETFGEGDESWRCVSMQFGEKHLYYATDAEFDRNRIYRVERSTSDREDLGQIDGPSYYSVACGGAYFFSVTAELCPSQQGRSASLWCLDPGGRLEKIVSFEKDRLPVSWFLPGTLHFPSGPGLAEQFFFHAVGLSGVDNRTFRVRRESGTSQ